MAPPEPEELDAGQRLRHGGRRLMRRAKYLMGEHPITLPILLRMTPIGMSRRITERTRLVVEGFPRSGNTFASYAIWHAAGSDFPLSSHVHHLAQLKLATRRGLPTVLVVREPLATLASYLIAGPHGRPKGVLKEYLSYYEGALPMLSDVLVVDFTEITGDMGAVIDRINARFDLDIPAFDHTPETVAAVFDTIQHTDALGMGEAGVARPSEERSADNARRRAELQAPELAPLLARANELYHRVRRSATH